MRDKPLVLAVDDRAENLDIVRVRLEAQGYEVLTATGGEAALAVVSDANPDLILLDVMMPGMDGIEVTRRLKGDPATRPIPILLLTAKADVHDVVEGLNAGADDYVTKPFDHSTLTARVRSLLRTKALYDTVERQAAELAILNRDLEARVARQVAELERTRSLRRFLAPQVADFLLTQGDEASILDHHRREIVVLFCDLRGFTSFAESAEPEEVMDLLGRYHATLGPLIHQAEGTLERFTGDGMMVFFNDPLPCEAPAIKAVSLAVEMRAKCFELARFFAARGHTIGFGVGIAQGYATLGRIGFEGRFDYAAIGTVTNIAARLCSEAQDGQILVTRRVAREAADATRTTSLGEVRLRGISKALEIFNVDGLVGDSSGSDENAV
jgi:class 3 adenylate cyclase